MEEVNGFAVVRAPATETAADEGSAPNSIRASAGESPGVDVRMDVPFKVAKRSLTEFFERVYLRSLISRHGGNLSSASREAKISRTHLRNMFRKHGFYESLGRITEHH